MADFSLIIPYYNNDACINGAFEAIMSQTLRPRQIVLIDDCSQNRAIDHLDPIVLSKLELSVGARVEVLRNRENLGLAASYNVGIKVCDYGVVVIMHPDISLPSRNELSLLLEPFTDPEVVIVGHHSVAVSDFYWNRLSLPEKLFVAASESKRAKGFNGQFDAFRKLAFDGAGGFNSSRYRTAGEDGDFYNRLKKLGTYKLSVASAQHHHDFRGSFGLRASIKKSLQYGNAQSQMLLTKGILFSAHRELLLSAAVISVFVNTSVAASVGIWIVIVSMRIPLLIFRRDKNLVAFFGCIAIELMRYFGHVSGFFLGVIRQKQTL